MDGLFDFPLCRRREDPLVKLVADEQFPASSSKIKFHLYPSVDNDNVQAGFDATEWGFIKRLQNELPSLEGLSDFRDIETV